MSEDRELLELAARAAGMRLGGYAGYVYENGALVTYEVGSWEPTKVWNPLNDDGDRYSLARAVKGNLYFSGRRGCFEIPSDGDAPPIVQHFTVGHDKEEAYAIVRAAAEIGRQQTD